MDDKKPYVTIGRAEKVYLPDYLNDPVVAKVDTGADLSSIWASGVHENRGKLEFKLFGPGSDAYTGKNIKLPEGNFFITRVSNSFGTKELRYAVKLKTKLKGKVIWATFTLSDRSGKTYPILLGRRMLQGKFVVDVSRGRPLKANEKNKKQKLQLDLSQSSDKLGE